MKNAITTTLRTRLVRILTSFVVFVALSSCGSLTPVEQAAADREELGREVRDEVSIGRSIAAKLLGHLGNYTGKEPSLQYVELVGGLLAARVGRPELTFRFAVLNSPTVNAYATPGGYVFVTKGLLNAVQNESELAGILAHEIAHVNERHMYRELRPKREVSAGESFVRILSRGGTTLGGSLTKIVEAGVKKLLEDGLGEEKEREADQIGTLYAQSAGYAPTGLITFLKRQRNTPRARLSHLAKSQAATGRLEPSLVQRAIMSERFKKALR